MADAALVILAAGMASRYGSSKQTEGMGPNGELIMEYSIYDALRAGYNKVVFVIPKGKEALMRSLCGDRVSHEAEVAYAVQDFSSLPAFYTVPEGRVKPYGTVHAVLCAAPYISSPFSVINADDYYGVDSFAAMARFLGTDAADDTAAMMGYRLKNTLSEHGTVTRGLCRTAGGVLTKVVETPKIARTEDGGIADLTVEGAPVPLDGEACVSMNFWGFAPSMLESMQTYFEDFLRALPPDAEKAECLLPVFADAMVQKGLKIRVLPTEAEWIGVTYKEDRPACADRLRALHEAGCYPVLHRETI